LERILSLAKKYAQEAEVFSILLEETPVLFEANRLKQLQTRQNRIIALRLIREGRIGFSTATTLEDGEALVNRAVEVSHFGAEAKFQFPSLSLYPQVEVYDPEIERVTLEQMVELGESAIARVREHTGELLCEATVSKGTVTVSLLNSRGGEATYRKSVFSLSLEGVLIRGTDMLFVGDSESSCHPITDFKPVVESVISQLELSREEASAPTGQVPVIFTPRGVASALIAPLVVALNGKVVLQGASPLTRRKGEQVFTAALNLWDDATIPYCPRSRSCDDEGIPSQRISLIEKGVVLNFLYDLQTAGAAGTQSTGSASRVNGGLPAPSPSTLIVGEGDASFEEMITDIKQGLVVDQLMGAEQTNILGGDFGGNVLLGFRVERGQMVGRVKDTMVSGNIYQALRELSAIGKESRWVKGYLRTPALYCPRLAVSSKG
jgi:PmbA protein